MAHRPQSTTFLILLLLQYKYQKLSTPMILRFNSWYPNLNEEIKRLDIESGKETNVLRLCGIPGCTKKFNSNHVMNHTCTAIDIDIRTRI